MENWKTMLDEALNENGETWADVEANTMTDEEMTMKSTIPTGISAYRDPATGDLAGSYPTQRDREILKLANEMASNRDGYGVAFYNDALLAFANKLAAEAAEEAARWRKAAEANIGENVELRQLLQNMEAARDAALRFQVERQPELGRIADALCEYNERDDQDAARYRWLRDVAEATDWEMLGYQDRGRRDAAIDDAMGGGDGHP